MAHTVMYHDGKSRQGKQSR